MRDDQLVAANNGVWSAAVLTQVVLAPVAGMLTATAGFGAAFAVNAANFLLSALLLARLRCHEPARPVPAQGESGPGRTAPMLAAIGVGAFCEPSLLRDSRPQPRALFGAFDLRGVVDLTLAVVTALPIALAAVPVRRGHVGRQRLLQRAPANARAG